MKTITVKDMKAHWAIVEAQVRDGETFEVLNRGKPTVRIVPTGPGEILKWDDHLSTSAEGRGLLSEALVAEDRDGRF